MFLSLESGDNDVTEVFLVLEQLLYDVYEVCGWFVWTEMQGLRDLKILVSKLKSGGFVDSYGFFRVWGVLRNLSTQ